MRIHLIPEKNRYSAGDTLAAELILQFDNLETAAMVKLKSLSCRLTLHHLQESFEAVELEETAIPRVLPIVIPVPELWRRPGYAFGVTGTCSVSYLDFSEGNSTEKQAEVPVSSAFDFINPDRPAVRYGFLCDFKTSDKQHAAETLRFFRRFHLTHIQYYDWVYRHHDYQPPAGLYRDMMGKPIDLSTVEHYIQACKAAGIISMAYGAVYAASREYLEKHPEQGLYAADGSPFSLIDTFYIMNLSENSPWSDHIIEQYRIALRQTGFDGIHLDTYGYPKQGWSYKEYGSGRQVFLEDEFPAFIDRVRKKLPDSSLIFNNVGNWPVHTTAKTDQDAVYIEVWEPYSSYNDLLSIIGEALPYGKPVIIAAYLAAFKNRGRNTDSDADTDFDTDFDTDKSVDSCLTDSACYLIAAVCSAGAVPLLFGEQAALLTQAYYNDCISLQSSEEDILSAYQDFSVRYSELLTDPRFRDITLTHGFGENREFSFTGAAISHDGKPGTILVRIRQYHHITCIYLINLTGENNACWNQPKNGPIEPASLTIRIPQYRIGQTVYYCSPDALEGTMREVPCRKVTGVRGPSLELQLDDLLRWGMVYSY